MLRNNIAKCLADRPRPMTKSALAKKLNVDRSYITLIEKGKRNPGSELLFRMAKILQCSVDDLFEYLPDPKKKV